MPPSGADRTLADLNMVYGALVYLSEWNGSVLTVACLYDYARTCELALKNRASVLDLIISNIG